MRSFACELFSKSPYYIHTILWRIFSASLLYPHIADTLVIEVFDELGPTPRLCFDLVDDLTELDHYKRKLDLAISQMTIEQLERLRNSSPLAMDELSCKICLITREDRDIIQSAPVIALA